MSKLNKNKNKQLSDLKNKSAKSNIKSVIQNIISKQASILKRKNKNMQIDQKKYINFNYIQQNQIYFKKDKNIKQNKMINIIEQKSKDIKQIINKSVSTLKLSQKIDKNDLIVKKQQKKFSQIKQMLKQDIIFKFSSLLQQIMNKKEQNIIQEINQLGITYVQQNIITDIKFQLSQLSQCFMQKNTYAKIKLINSQQITHQIQKNTTILQLKNIIYQKYSDQLQPKKMNLHYKFVPISNQTIITDLGQQHQFQFQQRKIQIYQVSRLYVESQVQDQITLQKGVAIMSCGHKIGKLAMIDLMNHILNEKKYKIQCPHVLQNQQICGKQWSLQLCDKVGIFTKSQRNQFEQKLSLNLLNQISIRCPFCNQYCINDIKQKTNKVRCLNCKSRSFCSQCLKPWKGKKLNFCGNASCNQSLQILKNAPWSHQFKLVDYQNEQIIVVKTPIYRKCVHCDYVIQINNGCKHMTCMKCKEKFCWVCLSVPQKGTWPCGKHCDYCGKVAKVQIQ